MRICTVGSNLSSSNVGDHAMFEGLRDLVLERWPDAGFTTFIASPERAREALGIEALAPKRHPFAMLKALAGSDALLITGGTPFYDDPARMGYLLALVSAAKLLGNKVIVYGITTRTLGPRSEAIVRRILRLTDIVGGRDARAVEFLQSLTRPVDKVRFIPDSSLGMEPAPAAEVDAWLGSHGLDPAAPMLAMCARTLASDDSHKEYYSQSYTTAQLDHLHCSLGALAVHAEQTHGLRTLILGCNTLAPDDDRVAARQIMAQAQALQPDLGIRLIEEQLRPRLMAGLLGRMRAVVSIRFHPTLLAMCRGTPTIALGYHYKSRAMLEVFGFEQYGLTAGEFDRAHLLQCLDEVLDRREAIAAQLIQRRQELVRDLREVVAELGDHVAGAASGFERTDQTAG